MGYIHWHGPRREGDEWVNCTVCNSAGVDYSRDCEPTDRAHLGGETPAMAYRGYLPTNLCPACQGEGGSWRPRSKSKTRLNFAYSKTDGGWVRGTLQTWYVEHGGWHPKITDEMREQYRWDFDNDTDPELMEVAK